MCVLPLDLRSVSHVGYTGKVAALLHTRFREVLMIDADCLPLMVGAWGLRLGLAGF